MIEDEDQERGGLPAAQLLAYLVAAIAELNKRLDVAERRNAQCDEIHGQLNGLAVRAIEERAGLMLRVQRLEALNIQLGLSDLYRRVTAIEAGGEPPVNSSG